MNLALTRATTQVNEKAFAELSDDNQVKVLCIYQIALTRKSLRKSTLLTVEQFNYLYDLNLEDLVSLTDFISSGTRYYNIEGE